MRPTHIVYIYTSDIYLHGVRISNPTRYTQLSMRHSFSTTETHRFDLDDEIDNDVDGHHPMVMMKMTRMMMIMLTVEER